ncbi:MAG TPA: alkaline phosphatase family protein [Woeseiaceae bacterium]|nr:alkaline phosphatase family protein [Woeseiaceae bacterium]
MPFSILGRVVLTIYSLSPPNPGQAIARMPVSSNTNVIRSVLILCLLLAPLVAEAYIGPGAGISFLQGLWVALVGLVLSILAIILLPIKLLWRTFGAAKFVLLFAGLGALLWFVSGHETRAVPGRVDARVIVLGFDGLDPGLAERWMNEGLMPNFARLAETGSYQALATTTPAQSPVAWSSFATGTGPGEHGIFDFLRRSTDAYSPDFSISETAPTRYTVDILGLEIPADGGEVSNRRIGEVFWMTAEKAGRNATVLRVPVTYPPDPIHRMLSGMGVPDLLGTQGTYSIFTTERLANSDNRRIRRVIPDEKGRVETALAGPDDPLGRGAALEQLFSIEPAPRGVEITINGDSFGLEEGQWSEWVRVKFDILGPMRTSGMVRFLLLQSYPLLKLYVSPINIDPYDPAVAISSPPEFAAELADEIGLFHTLGMPEETWSLNDGQISDADYLSMIRATLAEREAMWYDALDAHNTELNVAVFVQTDRVSHMFYRGMDEGHALYGESSDEVRGAIEWVYREADRILGETLERMSDDDSLIVLSDHGFAPFRKSVHLNRWLADAGYLVLKPGEHGTDSLFDGVDWSKTKAFALGLNGLFVNQQGREPQGIVRVEETAALKAEIAARLLDAVDPVGGHALVRQVFDRDAIYTGLANADAPDLVIGYARNYRASWQTSLGGTPPALVEINQEKWSGDHCIDPSLVPGVLFTSFPLTNAVNNIQDVSGLILQRLETQNGG